MVLVGFFLIGMGVVILFSPVSAGLKNFLGGVLAGAGVGLLVTEYIASLDRAERKRDHNQLVSRVGDLTETIKRLVRILGPQKVAVIGQSLRDFMENGSPLKETINGETVRYYPTRHHLPDFTYRLSTSTKEIHILGRTLLVIALVDFEPIKEAVRKGRTVNLYLLDPESKHLENLIDVDPSMGDSHAPKGQADLVLATLGKARKQMGNPDNFHVWTIVENPLHSFLLIDPTDEEHATIQVEAYPQGGYAAERPSRIGNRKECPQFFEKYYAEFLSLTAHKKKVF